MIACSFDCTTISMAQEIREKSPILNDMLQKGEIGLVGGMYNIETGIVEFYENVDKTNVASHEKSAV